MKNVPLLACFSTIESQKVNKEQVLGPQEDTPETRSCQSSRTLQVLNRCGVAAEVWFERGPSRALEELFQCLFIFSLFFNVFHGVSP